MFDEVLIESAGKDRRSGSWITALISAAIHVAIIVAIVAAGMYVKEHPEVIEKPIAVFISAAPPPPPPPPPAGGGGPRQSVPIETPRETPQEQFTQPRETPEIIPTIESGDDAGVTSEAGVPGGVPGGQRGGVVGGEIGGQIGGTLGGKVGGQLGGAGNMPVPVGGNVKAPIAVKRVEPVYTEIARRARMQGIVIIEAVIDREGNVTEARVLKPLGMGLDAAALSAVRQWKFLPGTLGGEPVPVYYSLTVNFRIE